MAHRTRLWGLRPIVIGVVDPVLRGVAGRLPGFGILTYPGRKTHRPYHTPLNVFRDGAFYTFVLTYGSDAEWVKNVLVEGGAWLRTQGRDVHLIEPELIVDPERSAVPAPLRFIGRLGGVTEFLRMRAVGTGSGPDAQPGNASVSNIDV